MFKITLSKSYKWPVKITLLDEQGQPAEQSFTAEFKRFSQSELEAIMAQSDAGTMKLKPFLSEALLGWNGVVDSNGNQLPFSEETRDQLLDVAFMLTTLVQAFFESLQGAKRKNSPMLPSTGQQGEKEAATN